MVGVRGMIKLNVKAHQTVIIAIRSSKRTPSTLENHDFFLANLSTSSATWQPSLHWAISLFGSYQKCVLIVPDEY
jgi:hypothetical protein